MKQKISWIPLVIGAAALLSPFARATEEKKKPATAASSRAAAADSELDRALAEFKASAERLGKSMAQVAEDGTTEARGKVMKTMNKAILELSHTMDRAAEKIGGSHKGKAESEPETKSEEKPSKT